jgi:hypothetical protein
MAKTTTKLNAQDRVILFCAATGINHAAVGILPHAMRSMAVRGFYVADDAPGADASKLSRTDSGMDTASQMRLNVSQP